MKRNSDAMPGQASPACNSHTVAIVFKKQPCYSNEHSFLNWL